MIAAAMTHNTITSASEYAFALCEKAYWGEKKKGKVEYSSIEALALLSQGKMQLYAGKKQIDEHMLLKRIKKTDKRIETKLAAFLDLRKKGHIIKTALKFGAEFRVYEKGTRPGKDHAAWLLFPVKENETLTWYDFAAKNRVATTTNKKTLIAIVDDAGDVTYYQVNWTRL